MRDHLTQNLETTSTPFMYEDFLIILSHTEKYENQKTVSLIGYESLHKPTSFYKCSLSPKSF